MIDTQVALYIEKANGALAEEDISGFWKNIGVAKYIAQNDENMLEVMQCEALALYRLHEYPQAVDLIEQILKSAEGENRGKFLRKKGVSLVKMGEYLEALNVFHCLIREYPDQSVWGIGNLGWVYIYLYQSKGEYEHLLKAEEYCRMALQLCSDDKDLYKKIIINMGNIEWLKCDYEKALHLFLEAADMDSKNPTILNNIAAVYINIAKENHHLRGKIEEYLSMAESIAEQTKNDFEMGQTYLIRARLSVEVDQDFITGKDLFLVAYDRFVSVHAFPEALKTLNRILTLDHQMNRESIELLEERFKSLFGKDINQKEKEVLL